jgi:probable O-glycosylation ligase (exosortase A-associated)
MAVPIAFFRPFEGLLIYLWLSFGRIGDFVWSEYTFDYLAMVAASCLVGYVLFEMPRSPIRLMGMIPLLLLWVWLAVVSVKAMDPSLAYPKLFDYSRGFIMAILTASLVITEKRVRSVMYVLAFSLGVLGAKGALDAVLTGFSSTMVGPGGMMAEANEYALALNMGIPILLLLAKQQSNKWIRLAFQGMAAGSALVVIGTRSRSGLCGLITVGLLMTALSKRKLLLASGLVLCAVLLLLFGPQGALDRYRTIPTATESDASAIGRLEAWTAAIKMTKAHPVFGVGLRNFMLAFPHYSDARPRVTHNAMFEMLAETGVPGCLFFFLMIFATIGQMFLLWLRARRNPDTEHLGTYCQIVMLTLIVYLVPNMFINRQDFDLMYQLVALGSGLAMVTKRRLSMLTVEQDLELRGAVADNVPLGTPPGESPALWQRALAEVDGPGVTLDDHQDETVPLWQRAQI